MDMREQSEDMILPISDPQSTPEAPVAAEDSGTPSPDTDDLGPQVQPLSKSEIIQQLTEIAGRDADAISRDEVGHFKQMYYSLRRDEIAAERAVFVDAGNDPEAFAPAPDPDEDVIKELLNTVKEKKAEQARIIEAQQLANLERKNAMIDEISTMSADTDNVNRHFQRFREIQTEFKEVGEVPPTAATDVWKRFQDAVERFYDQLKVNKDLRDYDFKKNLELKQLLIAQAEKLAGEPDVIVAFRHLQGLHDKWRETGPVDKEIREEIWAKFKEASAAINKRYQTFFEERKQKERDNEVAKNAICAEIEAIDLSSLKSFSAWDEMTRLILDAQVRWRKLGFASKKVNNALYERYRALCDKFFAEKAAYYRSVKDSQEENLRRKIELCEKAEAYMDSTDWRATGDALVALQKEWRTIGAVAKKQSDAVWRRFQDACETFFQRRKKATSGVRQTENANLKAKKALIASLQAITDETPREDAVKTLRDAMAQWGQIGHVPFRDKDKIYEAYRKIVDDLYERLDMRNQRAGMARFESNIDEIKDDQQKLLRERERLLRAYEQKNSELTTCQNNMGFFTSKSKSGDSMLRDLERRVEKVKEELAGIEQKIKVIDSHLA